VGEVYSCGGKVVSEAPRRVFFDLSDKGRDPGSYKGSGGQVNFDFIWSFCLQKIVLFEEKTCEIGINTE